MRQRRVESRAYRPGSDVAFQSEGSDKSSRSMIPLAVAGRVTHSSFARERVLTGTRKPYVTHNGFTRKQTPSRQVETRMVLYSFSIYDRHCRPTSFVLIAYAVGECVYHHKWNTPTNQTKAPAFSSPGPAPAQPPHTDQRLLPTTNKHEDDAKLLFGVVYSLRNITRKLSTP